MIPVQQQQKGIDDCGLFALVNLLALYDGENPCLNNFDQKAMREHSNKCNKDEFVTGFPQKSSR